MTKINDKKNDKALSSTMAPIRVYPSQSGVTIVTTFHSFYYFQSFIVISKFDNISQFIKCKCNSKKNQRKKVIF